MKVKVRQRYIRIQRPVIRKKSKANRCKDCYAKIDSAHHRILCREKTG